MAHEIRQSIQPRATLKGQLVYRLKFSGILSLSEKELARLVQDIENDPLIQRLMRSDDPLRRAIVKRRAPRTRISAGFYELNEHLVGSAEGVDVESLLARHKDVVGLIRKMGRDKFEAHFLYGEGFEPLASLADKCGITADEALRVQSLLLDFSIHSEFFNPTALGRDGDLRYSRVAAIEADADGGFAIAYTSPRLAGGRYVVDQERLKEVLRAMNRADRKRVSELLQKIEWINLRHGTLQKILEELIRRQDPYLKSGFRDRTLPVTQRELARDLKVSASTVCRVIYAKSVVLPWGEEKPIHDLFANKKRVAKILLGEILKGVHPETSDEKLRRMLSERHGIRVSRRSVNVYRREVREGAR